MKENINDNKQKVLNSSKISKFPKSTNESSILSSISFNASRDRMSELFNDFKKMNIDETSQSLKMLPNAPSIIGLNNIDPNSLQMLKKTPNVSFNSTTTTTTTSTSVPGSSNSNGNTSSVTDTLDQLKVENYTEPKQPLSSNLSTTTLYVGDLDSSVSEAALKKLFSGYKSLLSVKLCCSPSTKQSLGYGYVNFSDENDAQRAIEDLNYTKVSNKEIRIMPYMKGKNKSFMSANVFVSNLNNDKLTLRGFYEKFKHFGTVLSCKLELGKRQGFISFKDKDTAEKFVKTYNSRVVDGSKLHCSIHIPKSMRNFSSATSEYDQESLNQNGSGNKYKPINLSQRENMSDQGSLKSTVHTENLVPAAASLHSSTNHTLGSVISLKTTERNDQKFTQIYVKGLPVNVTEEEINDLFSPYGTITEIYKESVTNFKSSWCFVTFKDHSSAVNAVATCHKITYKGRKITCVKALKKAERQSKLASNESNSTSPTSTTTEVRTESCSASNQVKPTTKLYICNLHESVNENFFKLFLRQYKLEGQATKFSFNRGHKGNYIEFENYSDAKAIQQKLNGVTLYGLVLKTSLHKLDNNDATPSSHETKAVRANSNNVTVPFTKVSEQHESKSIPHLPSTNFHPIGHHPHHPQFIDGPMSPPPVAMNNYFIPSLSSINSVQSLLPSIPSGSTNITSPATSQAPIIHNINGKQYKLVPISNSSSVNERSLDVNSAYILSKQANSPLSYLDLYTTGIESESNEQLLSDLEKISLRYIDFLKYPSATRPRNLKKILNYLVVTLWDNNIDSVKESVSGFEKNPEFSNIFKERLIGAIKLFGFER